MNDNAAIVCSGIKKSYGVNENRVDALKGIDLEIYKGQLTLLVGPSGSGKSTLLSIITTILTPDEGKLILNGQDPSLLTPGQRADFCRHNLGIVFQSLFLIPTLTVAENISLPLLVDGQPQHESLERAKESLVRMKLSHKANVVPTLLSKGQQQRIAIARAMINNAKIIVCDEPTSALDHTTGMEIMELLHEVAADPTRAVLVVTHDHRIFSFADRIINMSDGQIIKEEVK